MTRNEVLAEVETLLNTYCNGCFLKKHHRQENGKRYAHRFCINECTVGEKIKKCGQKL
ncbi:MULTISPECIES: zinc-finger domain-containing protein [Mesobacillus]|uniref:zinc-finger domain-containing protein n=1 Tax=Mesobacillus TaxID=2675231 RepID=UPI001781F7BB|nr:MULTISPECIES: zinc-finger domain-containing protein [Mesobacillus]MCM3571583.1 zinc-finger domain-containing protein [Mesobacillus subterraneus]UYZ20498.1 zinc-finger domain-containing protein [Mesobacillus jeotgali]